jgi:ribosomal protein S21
MADEIAATLAAEALKILKRICSAMEVVWTQIEYTFRPTMDFKKKSKELY